MWCWPCIFCICMLDIILYVKRSCSKLTSLCYNMSLIRFKKIAKCIADIAKNNLHTVQTFSKNNTYFFFKRKQIICIPKITMVMQQETIFFKVLYKNDVTGRPTSFYRGKWSALFCCRGRIGIKYLFSWLLQKNLLIV